MSLGLYRTGIFNSRRREIPVVPPVSARGIPEDYGLPAAPAGTLREIQLPADIVQIQALLNAAVPGDSFIAPNTTLLMERELTIKVAGTAENPISLRGTAATIFETDNGDYGLHILHASYVHILGGVYRYNKKGIVLDNSKHCVLRYVRVMHCEQEAIHFRASSSDGLVEYCTIEATGEVSADFGEGFYVGSHNGNWSSPYYDRSSPVEVSMGVLGNEGGVDRSDRVTLQYCQVINTTAEGLDYKQGVFDIVVRENDFYAAGWSGENSADSPIDLKGDNALIENNDFYPLMPDNSFPTNPNPALAYIQRSCIQARVLTAPYGHNHVIKNNRAHGTWDAYLFEAVSGSSGNTVYDDNVAPGAALGIANIPLTPVGGSGGGEPVEPEDVSSAGVMWSNTGSVSPSLSPGWASGDLMVLCAIVRTLEVPSTPAGWTLQTSGVGSTLGAAVFTRTAQTGDTAPQITTSGSADVPLGAFITTVKNWSGTPTVAADYTEVLDDPTCPSMTASSGATVLRLIGLADNQAPDAQPAGVTPIGVWSTSSIGEDAALGGWYATQAQAGATGTVSVGYNSTDPWVAFTVVVPA